VRHFEMPPKHPASVGQKGYFSCCSFWRKKRQALS